jgi:glycosyltransferase involved in cell wall biosynthesis
LQFEQFEMNTSVRIEASRRDDARSVGGGVSGSLGYLVPEFPQQTHIFFWREIQALEASGVSVRLISTRKPDLSECKHAFAPQAVARTHYVYPPRLLSVARHLALNPLRLTAALGYLAKLSADNCRERLKQQGLLACALDLANFCGEENITHIHGHSCADAAHLLALCQLVGGPRFSLTLHGDLEVYGRDHQAKMADAAFVSVVGSHLKEQVHSATMIARDRVWVTCMGIESERLGRLTPKRSDRANQLRLVTVARLDPMKGHRYALAAVRALRDAGVDVHYVIVGGGDHRAELARKVAALDLLSNVTFAGTLGEEDVTAELMRADVFVLPSVGHGEAWPVSVMEAMACGLPVVATIIGATPEMITPDVDGLLLEQHNEKAIADALLRLARDPELRRRMGQAAKKTARERFDVGATASRLLSAIVTAQG